MELALSIGAVDLLEEYPFNQLVATNPVVLLDPVFCNNALYYFMSLNDKSANIKTLLTHIWLAEFKSRILDKQFEVLSRFYKWLKDLFGTTFFEIQDNKYLFAIVNTFKNIAYLLNQLSFRASEQEESQSDLVTLLLAQRKEVVTEASEAYSELCEHEGFYEWSCSDHEFISACSSFSEDIEYIDCFLQEPSVLTENHRFVCELLGTIEGLIKYKTQLFFLLSQFKFILEDMNQRRKGAPAIEIMDHVYSSLGASHSSLTKQISAFQKLASESHIQKVAGNFDIND